MRGPSKFVWSGLKFVRGPHPAGRPKNCWFHDPLKLAVVETQPGCFTAYARLPDVYEDDENGDGGATVYAAQHDNLSKWSPDQHSALDALVVQLQREVDGPWTAEEVRMQAACLIDEIEASRA